MSAADEHSAANPPAGVGRADWRRAAAAARLPAPLAALVTDIVRRSRLWRTEKADLARELAAHFADGLASGRSPEDLAMDFGDPRRAARLVRRAKQRNRHWTHRAFIHTCQGFGAILLAFLVVYAILAWRFFGGEPVIKRNYTAEYNEKIDQIPENERAYDVYLEAWALIPPKPDSILNSWPAIAPEHPAYPDALEYLERAAPAIELIHQAAARPHLGAPLSDAIDPRFAESLSARRPGDFPDPAQPSANPPLVTILLPVLGEFRENARLLTFDAHEAARRADAERALRDLASMLGLADHPADQPTLISQLVGLAIHALATQTASEIIHEHPHLFTDEHLRELAHRNAAFMGGRPRIDLSGERSFFEDAIQRVYSDDGRGNGYITAQGLRDLTTSFNAGYPVAPAISSPLGPIAGAIVADRAAMTVKFEELMTRLEHDAQLPLWRYDERSDTQAIIDAMDANPIERTRYLPVVLLVPALSSTVVTAEQTMQRRDALLTGIALELYKREHGDYPETLDALVPRFLPAVAPDRFTGKPLNYAVIDGEPRLWSVGADRKNDGGRAPSPDKDMTRSWLPAADVAAYLADPELRPHYDGDWILWPLDYRPLKADPGVEPQPVIGGLAPGG